jgi:hypothetical protein
MQLQSNRRCCYCQLFAGQDTNAGFYLRPRICPDPLPHKNRSLWILVISLAQQIPASLVKSRCCSHRGRRVQIQPNIPVVECVLFERSEQRIRNAFSPMRRPHIHPLDLAAVFQASQFPQRNAPCGFTPGSCQPNPRPPAKIPLREFRPLLPYLHSYLFVIFTHEVECLLDLTFRSAMYHCPHLRVSPWFPTKFPLWKHGEKLHFGPCSRFSPFLRQSLSPHPAPGKRPMFRSVAK